jgi:hypothetical protein
MGVLMAELTSEQRAFLAAHAIPLSAVFDASGMRRPDYQATMKGLGKSFAFGVTPCNRAMHTLRTRAGHCIQCDTSKIAYMLRYDATAFIYIAGSANGQLIKVGSSGDVHERRGILNGFRYGGQSDWQMLAFANCPSAGRVEFAVHAELSPFQVPGRYTQGGKERSCYELFRCDFADARDAVCSELPKGIDLKVFDEDRALREFAFRSS